MLRDRYKKFRLKWDKVYQGNIKIVKVLRNKKVLAVIR